MNLKPKKIKFHCSIKCPSGRLYEKGIHEVKDITEEDISFVMERQTTVIEWEDSKPKKTPEIKVEIEDRNQLGE